jgi:ATP-dependent DNA ligase
MTNPELVCDQENQSTGQTRIRVSTRAFCDPRFDTQLAASLDQVRADAFLVDGEITASRFDVWDLLTVDHTNLRDQLYEMRYAYLFCRFQSVHDLLRVAETLRTTQEKRRFVDTMHRIRAEGFVCKNRHAAYAGGRAGQHFKCKFVTSASFIVGPKPAKKTSDGHRSIAVYLLEEGRQRFMGTVGGTGALSTANRRANH